MPITDEISQKVETDIDIYTETLLPPLQHQWLLPASELLVLNTAFPTPFEPETAAEERQRRKAIRQAIIAQLNRGEATAFRDLAYLAFLVVKNGRGGEIVGDPYAITTTGKTRHQEALPYTGLEGYYAGSQKTATRPGLAPEYIVLEEANIGAELLRTMKRRYIEHNAWVEFARLQQMLDKERPDAKELKIFEVYFGMIVGRLHVRIYRNPEFALTLSEQVEQLEQLLREAGGRAKVDQRFRHELQRTYETFKRELESRSEKERQQERQERRRREQVRAERLAAFQTFRAETYRLLATSSRGRYTVGVDDTSPDDVVITEQMTLPNLPGRQAYPPTYITMTPEQVRGYLFLAKMGDVGGSPVVRSVYR